MKIVKNMIANGLIGNIWYIDTCLLQTIGRLSKMVVRSNGF